MGLFDRLRKRNAAARLVEEQIYEIVANEVENGIRRSGLWAKALANSAGDESKAKSLYISYRAQSLIDEHEIAEAARELEAEEASRRQDAELQQKERERETRQQKAKQERETRERKALEEERKALEEEERQAQMKTKEALEILREKGYRPQVLGSTWIVYEPLGGRQKITTAIDLYQYAITRENHSKR